MKAAVYEGKEQLIVRDVPVPALEDGDVLLKVEACNVCGVDLRTYRHGDKKIKPPRVLGHEFCGRIVEAKTDLSARGLAVGDRVVVYIVMTCGVCRYCKAGKFNLCETRTTMAYHHDGAFAEYIRIPAVAVQRNQLFKVKEGILSKHAALTEPLGCCIHAHRRLNISIEDTVAVIGAGPIGAFHGLIARLQGAQKVFMLDVSAERLKYQETFGFDDYIVVDKQGSHIEKVKQLTDGQGVNAVIVACGVAQAQADALVMAAKAGRIEFFGGLPKSNPLTQLDANLIHYNELVVTGSFSETITDFEIAYKLVQNGRIPGDKLVTHEVKLENILDAFPLIEKGEALKVSVTP